MPNMTDINIIQSLWNQAWSLLPITNNVDKTHVVTTPIDLAQKFIVLYLQLWAANIFAINTINDFYRNITFYTVYW